MERDEEVVDEFHLGRSAEITEMKTGLGKRGHDGFHFLNRLRGTTQVNDAFALHHHAGSAADLAVQKRDVLGRKWCDILLFDRYRMRAEFDHDLTWTCRFKKTVAAAHDILEGLIVWQAGKYDLGLRTDIGRGSGDDATKLLEIFKRAAPITDDDIAVLDQMFADWKTNLTHADETDLSHARGSLLITTIS
jgi:hypothetical protein